MHVVTFECSLTRNYTIIKSRIPEEQCLVGVHKNGDKDLTDVLDKRRKKESESKCMRVEERALV